MNKNIRFYLTATLLVLGLPLLFQSGVFTATFDLNYTLTEGGFQLKLDPSTPYKGVQLNVTSDVSTRYEVIQKITMPLQNRDTGTVVRDNFVVRGLRGTNRTGDFRISPTDIPVRDDEKIYVSDLSGTADTMTLVYGITHVDDLEPGSYWGKIAFILNPISSTRAQVTKILDVYVTINRGTEATPKIEISTPTGTKNIILNPKKDELQSADILIKINGTFRKPFSIVQYLTQPLESEEGYRLNAEGINFVVKEAKKGMGVNKATPLASGFQNVYTSMPSGDADKYFIIAYSLSGLTQEKAGRYRSRIQYLLDQMGTQTNLDSIDLQVDNERVFDLIITPADQRYGIEFRDVKSTEPARQCEVLFEIKSNVGKRYQISQEVLSDLTNSAGDKIPSQYFTLRTESVDNTKGTPKFPNKETVKNGSSVLFISDGQGSSDKFKSTYELEPPKDVIAGDYSTRITYSLLEI